MGSDSGGFAGYNPPRGLGGNPSLLPPLLDFRPNKWMGKTTLSQIQADIGRRDIESVRRYPSLFRPSSTPLTQPARGESLLIYLARIEAMDAKTWDEKCKIWDRIKKLEESDD